jgi:hypothetical protein
MKTLVGVKKDMEFNKGLTQLVETLKSIAIAQYYAMEKRMDTFAGPGAGGSGDNHGCRFSGRAQHESRERGAR